MSVEEIVKPLLLQAPAFTGKAFYAVTVYSVGKLTGRSAKANLYRSAAINDRAHHLLLRRGFSFCR
jgi:hypothetical protein